MVTTNTTYSIYAEAHGISKYKVADYMRNSMHIPDEVLPLLDVYKMVHWNSPAFKNVLIDGTIKFAPWRDITFNVIYHQCTPALAKRAKEIRLSFRAAKPEFNIEPIVLVQIVIQGD